MSACRKNKIAASQAEIETQDLGQNPDPDLWQDPVPQILGLESKR